MKEKQYKGPGVFTGLSTDKAYEGKSITVKIDSKLAMVIDLTTPLPTTDYNPGAAPDQPLFFKHSLLIKYPKEAEIETFVVV